MASQIAEWTSGEELRNVPECSATWREVEPPPATLGKDVELVNSNGLKHAVNLAQWKERIIDCRASGLTVQVWCEKNGWNKSTYYRWEREIFGRMAENANQGSEAEPEDTALVPIAGQQLVEIPVVEKPVAPPAPAYCPVAVVRVGEMELSLTNAVSPRLMKQLKEMLPRAK